MKQLNPIEKISYRVTNWVGTPASVVVHSIIFAVFAYLATTGLDFNKIMLIWNTTVSLEAIYLALFIQMTVNRHTESLEELEEDVEDISEDIEDIQEDEKEEVKRAANLDHIEAGLQKLIQEIETLKAKDQPHKESIIEKIQRKII